jgi:hypothetical protein
MNGHAEFSPDRAYRYLLTRQWGDGPTFVVVGLNPSTADERVDDPTIRRCVGFAKREHCGALAMVNLFAKRATDPADLYRTRDPVGPENDHWLAEVLGANHAFRVAAWGANKGTERRETRLRQIVADGATVAQPLFCLGLTKKGSPKHPLYLRTDAPLMLYPWRY